VVPLPLKTLVFMEMAGFLWQNRKRVGLTGLRRKFLGSDRGFGWEMGKKSRTNVTHHR